MVSTSSTTDFFCFFIIPNARDFSEFAENWEKTIPALLRNFLEQNSEIKKSNLKLISQFLKTAGKTFTELM